MAGAAGAGAAAIAAIIAGSSLPFAAHLAPWLPGSLSLRDQRRRNALQRGDDEGAQLLRHTASPFCCHHGRVCSPTLRARVVRDGGF